MDLVAADVEGPKRRRRGAALEDAILEAAWAELTEKGYAQMTMESVAERAGTSKSVVYRRWAAKQELVRAALARMSLLNSLPMPDTGSLRGDLLALVRGSNESRVGLAAVFMAHLGTYYEESGSTPADLRLAILQGREQILGRVFERAIERGEVDPDRLTPRIIDLTSTLFRHEVLMTLAPVPDDVMEEIVDTIVLPLVRRR